MPLVGHGIGLRTQHYARFLEERPAVDWLEVISENFMVAGGRPLAVLEKVRRDYPVAMHGVSLSIGGSDPLDASYLKSLRLLEQRIEPALVSDHLCWGGSGGHHAHDLLPLPYTQEALAHVSARVDQVQTFLGRPLVLENVSSYLTYVSSEMTEWEFLAELTRRTGCGLLLDVNNVYVSARNHGFDPDAYLAGIPRASVRQFHLAGHTDHGDYVIDTHEGRVVEAVWALHRRAVQRFGRVPTLIEWDEAVPELEAVLAQSARAREEEQHALAEARG